MYNLNIKTTMSEITKESFGVTEAGEPVYW